MLIMQQKKDFFIDALHIFVLFSFALAQPLFDLLSRNAEFFVAHHSEPVDIILLILILCALLPALVVLIEVVAGLFGRRARKGVHGFMVASLLTVIALPALNKILEFSGTALLVGAAILGVATTIVYMRFRPVRIFLTVLSPAILLFPGLFLFNSPVFKVVFPEKDPSAVTIKMDNAPPIIMVVFDEFPVTSLMDEHRQIDPIRYPNFAALARDAYWFRNATTVSDSTQYAIPAILTGNYADLSRLPCLPTATEHPKNIFTLLGGSYDLKVFEPITELCPERLCSKPFQIFTDRMGSLILDLSIVYLHILLPEDFTSGLPDVTQTWKDFPSNNKDFNLGRRADTALKAAPQIFEQFLESITMTQRPSLYFLHVMVPHFPWIYLPSGKQYSMTGDANIFFNKRRWVNDETLVIYGYQRHLLQVGFVDSLVGKLLDKLKLVGLYNRSLIVITADHGVSFRPNIMRRVLTQTNYQDIMSIPLFIKAPNQHVRVISDRNVETIDILPIIADILGISLPWQIDGHSARDSSFPERSEKVIFRVGGDKPFVFGSTLNAKYESLERMLTLFGSGVKPDGLFKIGPHNNLVGQHVSEIGVTGESGIVVDFDQVGLYENVDPDAPFVPAQITGVILKADTDVPLNLALAVNGTIRATTRTYPLEGGIHEWSAIVPETSFRAGKNDIEIFIVSLVTGKLSLARTQSQSAVTYSFASGVQGRETIITSDGKSIPVISGALHGFLDSAGVSNDRVKFSGWAADVKNSELPEAIVIFVNEKFVYSGRTRIERPDVVKAYGDATLRRSGFTYALLLEDFKGINNPEVRVFAVSQKGIASELHYPQGYKWGRKS